MKDLPETEDAIAQWCKDVFLAKVKIFFTVHRLIKRMLTLHLVQRHVLLQCFIDLLVDRQTVKNLPILLHYYHVIYVSFIKSS